MTIKNANAARQTVNARLQSYIAAVREQLPGNSAEFWRRIEPPPFSSRSTLKFGNREIENEVDAGVHFQELSPNVLDRDPPVRMV